MKVVLFCGGLGLRIRDAADNLPKPLVAIGNRPILWHMLKYYAHHGHREFILCLGYGGAAIQEYCRSLDEPGWRFVFADTGAESNVGQRLALAEQHLDGDDLFLCNYSDCLTDLHLPDLVEKLTRSNKVAAMLCAKPALSYHFVRTRDDGTVAGLDAADAIDLRINGGYFVFQRRIFDYIRTGEDLVAEPFHRLIDEGQLLGYRHTGFWRTMDTFKDKQALDELCASGGAPWEVWKRDSK